MIRVKCFLPFPQFGGNLKTTHLIVTFCFTNITRITCKSKHTVKYPDLPSAVRPFPHSEGLFVPNPLENLNFSDDNSDSNDHGQQGGDNVDCIPTLEVVPHLNPIY